MKSSEIRRQFLEFFASRDHTVVPSSSLIPAHDPSLMFTNAGMVQFKDVFLGQDARPYRRAASSQRCLRAGGKHNDLENVGYTARHHTFFEMLGNFSFGDYFKGEAIRHAWAFLTETMGIDPDRLWVTVHADDTEAADIWLKELGVDGRRFSRIDTSDNFWQMGDTGPCGPCSEIFYDHGPEVPGGPPGSVDADGDRYVEIWNLVFMQYNRDHDGVLHPLPRPSVDTGMGLERIAAVMQGVHSNYDIDLFQELIHAAGEATGCRNLTDNSLKVIADHIRACSFLVLDGVLPGNDGRAYVLRRIIRRAIRHGYKLGCQTPFFHRLVADLARVMGEAYPELSSRQQEVAAALRQEEERFAETLSHGMALLERAMAGEDRILAGETVFQLYDTFGFPLDLTADIARERGYTVDFSGFEAAMEEQRARARAASRFTSQQLVSFDGEATRFTGYDGLRGEGRVVAIFRGDETVPALEAGESGLVVLDETPFYPESGGQVGDRGRLLGEAVAEVTDTRRIRADVTGHAVAVQSGQIRIGASLTAEVDAASRGGAAHHHSVTHLLHAALRRVLGTHVAQKGSLVGPDRTRFDFSHPSPVSGEEIAEIEELVNGAIRANHAVETRLMPFDEAVKSGAMALFDEKYGDVVRVVRMGDFSTELCGGTHVCRTGDIGYFKVVAEGGVASGVRRLEAVAGNTAEAWVRDRERLLAQVAGALKAQPQEVAQKLTQTLEQLRHLEKELARFKSKLASSQGEDLAASARQIGPARLVAARIDGVDGKALRETLDGLRDRLGSCVVVLASVGDGGRVALVAGVSADLTDRLKAGELVNHVARQVGGKGGGRPDMAQAGGDQPGQLPAALDSVAGWVEQRLQG